MVAASTTQLRTRDIHSSSSESDLSSLNLNPYLLRPSTPTHSRKHASGLQPTVPKSALSLVSTRGSSRSDVLLDKAGNHELKKATSVSAVLAIANKLTGPSTNPEADKHSPFPASAQPKLCIPSPFSVTQPPLSLPESRASPAAAAVGAQVVASPEKANVPPKASSTTHCLVARAITELSIKAQVLHSFHELNSCNDESAKCSYNPLRAIRSRTQSAAKNSGERSFLWNVAASELVNDFAWRRCPQPSLATSSSSGAIPMLVFPDSDGQSTSSGKSILSISQTPSPRSLSPTRAAAENNDTKLIHCLRVKYEHCRSDCSLVAGPELSPLSPYSRPIVSNDTSSMSAKSIASSGAVERRKTLRSNIPMPSEPESSSNDDLTSFHLRRTSVDVDAACREAQMAQNDLLFMLAVYKTISRRMRRVGPYSRKLLSCATSCTPRKSEALDRNAVPNHLERLAQFGQLISERSSVVETQVGRPVESLRIESERLISEVNTTLSRQVRELSAQLDKFETSQRTACLFNVGYNVLELLVVVILRLIWAIFALFALTRNLMKVLC